MPNWCENTLTVTGDPEMLEQFKEHVKSDNGNPLSFMKILPISCSEDEQAGKANQIWGTKWDVGDGCWVALEVGKNGKSLAYCFDTAWSPPIPVVYEMSRMFPKLRFKLRYCEPGMGFSGTYVAKDGSVIKDIARAYR